MALKPFTIIGYIFVLLNEARHMFGLDLPQCLFHMPHIVPRMCTVMEECNERLNALVTMVVLESQAVTDVAAEVNVPLEKLSLESGRSPWQTRSRNHYIDAATQCCCKHLTSRANSATLAGSTRHRRLHSLSRFSAAWKAAGSLVRSWCLHSAFRACFCAWMAPLAQ